MEVGCKKCCGIFNACFNKDHVNDKNNQDDVDDEDNNDDDSDSDDDGNDLQYL